MKSMDKKERSPRIINISWGHLEVEGQALPYKDAKLFPGGSREWQWGETGTSHNPGIQPADIEELLEHGAKVIVLSKGDFGRLGVKKETLQMLKERGIPVHVHKTKKAVQRYNELAEKEKVGALIHSTC
jgi:hypothetical protein